MSDAEDISPEDLEAEQQLEKEEEQKQTQEASSDENAESGDGEAEEEPTKKSKRATKAASESDGEEEEEDDDEELSDAGKEMEDHSAEDRTTPPGSAEPSDADDLEEEEERSVRSTEEEKRLRKHTALQFLDLEADVKTAKGIIKAGQKKLDDPEEQYEVDSIMDPEGEENITYNTSEDERRKKKSAAKKKAKAKEKKRKDRRDSDSEDEDAELVKKATKAKKQRRIRKVASSSSESDADDEEAEKEKPPSYAKATIHVIDDEELEHMTVINGTSKKDAINGAPPKKKAGFGELADIAKAVLEKKNAKIDKASLVYSPAKAPKKEKAASSAAAAAAGSSSATKKEPTPRKPKANKLEYKTGDTFEYQKKLYRVTYRGEDTPMTMGPTGVYSFIPNSFHPKQFTTCQVMEVGENGESKETQQFEHFQTSPDRKPKKLCPKYEQNGWTNFNTQTNEEMYNYAVRAIKCGNFEVDEAAGVKRMFFLPKVFDQVKKEGYRQEDGSWGWAPKHISAREFAVGTYNLKGEQVDKAGNPLPDAESGAAAAPTAKKSPVKVKKEVKPKIERVKEKGSHDVAQMLIKKVNKSAVPPPAAAAAVAPPAAPTSNGTHKASSLIPSNLFSDDDEPAAAAASSASSPFLYNNDNVTDFFSQLMGNYIDLRIKKNEVELLKERFKEVADTMDEAAKFDNPMDKRKFVTEKYKEQNGVALAMHLFPFLNADAAKMVREKLKM